jgi:hypothetical protein
VGGAQLPHPVQMLLTRLKGDRDSTATVEPAVQGARGERHEEY